jgi:HlyD family secretion protein
MRRGIAIVVVLLLIAAGAVGGGWFVRAHPEVVDRLVAELGLEAQPVEGITGSGFIEAEEVAISSEVGGRIEAITADEGDEVQEGQVLIRLDTAMLEAQIRQAEAAVEAARAALAQVEAGVREEEIRKAEAALAQAIVARDGAEQAWEDAQAIRDNPQELNARIDAARAQLAVAEHQVQQTIAVKDAAEEGKVQLKRAHDMLSKGISVEIPLPDGGTMKKRVTFSEEQLDEAWAQYGLAANEWWEAWVALNSATAARDGAQQNLENLLAMREKPLTMDAQVDAAQAQYEAAEAAVEVAQAGLDALRAGAAAEQVAVAQAKVRQAEAALRTLQVQLEKMTLKAPRDGLVVERLVHVGEMATPGAPLLKIADLDQVELTIYIPETEVGRVGVGQRVEVTVDSYPERTFAGQVVFIASQAEFTPKNVQTKEERVNMVFAVKAQIPNPDHALKPGMPADAVIEGTQGN